MRKFASVSSVSSCLAFDSFLLTKTVRTFLIYLCVPAIMSLMKSQRGRVYEIVDYGQLLLVNPPLQDLTSYKSESNGNDIICVFIEPDRRNADLLTWLKRWQRERVRSALLSVRCNQWRSPDGGLLR